MILIQTKKLSKSYSDQKVLSDVSLVIQAKERVGLVGPNGAGKTTLLRCLTGEENWDSGEAVTGDMVRLGYLEQVPDYPPGVTLFEAVLDIFADLLAQREELKRLEQLMSQAQGRELKQAMTAYGRLTEEYERAGGFGCEAMTRRVIIGLGFNENDLGRDITSFSGGEKTKVSIARVLVREYDLLLLDEPTNHLDLQSVEWLEGYLKNYPGAILIISHDRYFLDQLTQRTLELNGGTLESYNGNYSRYIQLKEEKTQAQLKAYEKQQKMIASTEEYIDKYRAGIKSKQARGRESRLSRLERVEKPVEARSLKLGVGDYKVAESANIVLKVKDLSLAFGEKRLWENLNFTLHKGDKVALIGPNGAGKTTLLKVLQGELAPDKGRVTWGMRVKPESFDQEHRGLAGHNRIIDEIILNTELSLTEARNILGSFLFRGDDVFKQVRDLSGGEKGRLSFLKLLLAIPNFLLLDEPTNHLDIASRTVIEDYLAAYEGTILAVSHDRYFLDRVTSRTLELDNQGLTDYQGNYSYYRDKKSQAGKVPEIINPAVKTAGRVDKGAKARANKAQTREKLAKLETEIERMEARLSELTQLLAESSTYKDEVKARAYVDEYQELEMLIPASYKRWEELQDLLTEITTE